MIIDLREKISRHVYIEPQYYNRAGEHFWGIRVRSTSGGVKDGNIFISDVILFELRGFYTEDEAKAAAQLKLDEIAEVMQKIFNIYYSNAGANDAESDIEEHAMSEMQEDTD